MPMLRAAASARRNGYIAYDPQEDTETFLPRRDHRIVPSYIAYDPQEDTETAQYVAQGAARRRVTSPTIRKRILKRWAW